MEWMVDGTRSPSSSDWGASRHRVLTARDPAVVPLLPHMRFWWETMVILPGEHAMCRKVWIPGESPSERRKWGAVFGAMRLLSPVFWDGLHQPLEALEVLSWAGALSSLTLKIAKPRALPERCSSYSRPNDWLAIVPALGAHLYVCVRRDHLVEEGFAKAGIFELASHWRRVKCKSEVALEIT